jgi:Spy/CpxP family protein refolding chaperone
MSLEGIGRVYNVYRDELRLTEAQVQAIHSLLEAARREVLRLGTEIDLSRTEADELVTRLDVDPEAVRAKMQKTGETEGVLFNKLFEVSDKIHAQLMEEQRKKLAELKQISQRRGTGKGPTGHAGGERPGTLGFDYFLDQTERLGLTAEQIAALLAAKNETRKTILIEQAKLKGAELTLLNALRDQDSRTPAPEDKLTTAVRGLEEIRSRITFAKALGYLKARQLLAREQQQRVHPPQMLDDGR